MAVKKPAKSLFRNLLKARKMYQYIYVYKDPLKTKEVYTKFLNRLIRRV